MGFHGTYWKNANSATSPQNIIRLITQSYADNYEIETDPDLSGSKPGAGQNLVARTLSNRSSVTAAVSHNVHGGGPIGKSNF